MKIIKPLKSNSFIIIPKILDMMGDYIDPYEYRVLTSLYNNKDGFKLTHSGLSRRIGMDRRTIPKVINRLFNKRLIIIQNDDIYLLNNEQLKKVSVQTTGKVSLQTTGGVT
jgi:hypothetical protein